MCNQIKLTVLGQFIGTLLDSKVYENKHEHEHEEEDVGRYIRAKLTLSKRHL